MLSSTMLCYPVLFCSILIYIWLSSSSGRSIDDQVLDLALMTNYSQSTFMWTVARLVVSICIDSILSGLVIQHTVVGKLFSS